MPSYNDYVSLLLPANFVGGAGQDNISAESDSSDLRVNVPVSDGKYQFYYMALSGLSDLDNLGYYDVDGFEYENIPSEGLALTTIQTYIMQNVLHTMLADVYSVTFEDVANIQFNLGSTSTAEITVGQVEIEPEPDRPYIAAYTALYNGNPDTELRQGDVWLNALADSFWNEADKGAFGYFAFMHEIGHALGLKGDNEVPGNLDNHQYTIMSYKGLSGMYNDEEGEEGEVTPFGLQVMDIVAIQEIYGRNYNTRTGDTAYSSETAFASTRPNDAFIYTIWDGDGADTIDASGYDNPGGAIIDLRQGEFSSIGYDAEGNNAKNNLAIAYYTIIEDAIGTDNADTIIGNAWDNILDGGDGDDRLFGDGVSLRQDFRGWFITHAGQVGFHEEDEEFERPGVEAAADGSGDDWLYGGDGDDHLYGGRGDDVLDGGDGNDFIRDKKGANIIDAGAGDDRVWGGGLGSVIDLGAGADRLDNPSIDTIIYTGADNDTDTIEFGINSYIMDAGFEDRIEYFFWNLTGGGKWHFSESEWTYADGVKYAINTNGDLVIRSILKLPFIGGEHWQTFVNDYTTTLHGSAGNTAGILLYEYDYEVYRIGEIGSQPANYYWLNTKLLDAILESTLGDMYTPSNADPIVFDLDNDGLEIRAESILSPHFDMNGDGFAERVGWIGSGDAYLVRDLNANGKVDDISEMFGTATMNGYSHMATLDLNTDGVLNSSDAAWADLKLWRDIDGDAVTDAGELLSLSSQNIVSIAVTPTTTTPVSDTGYVITAQGVFTRDDTSTGTTGNVIYRNNMHDTRWLTDVTVSTEAQAQPDIMGRGTIPDLWKAMTVDSDLLELVEETLPLMNTPDLQALLTAALPILTAWRDVAEIPAGQPGTEARSDIYLLVRPTIEGGTEVLNYSVLQEDGSGTYYKLADNGSINAPGGGVIARPTAADILADNSHADASWVVLKGDAVQFLERWLGTSMPLGEVGTATGGAAHEAGLDLLNEMYGQLNQIVIRIAAQSDAALGEFFEGITYDVDSEVFRPTTDYQLSPMLEKLFEEAPADAAGAYDYMLSWKPLLDVFMNNFDRGGGLFPTYGFLFKNIVTAFENTGFAGGLIAAAKIFDIPEEAIYMGSETLSGSGDADIIYLGEGNQTAKGNGGYDNFVVGRNFGQDKIIEIDSAAGTDTDDTVRFAHVLASEVTATRVGNDLIITVDATGDALTIVDQFKARPPSLTLGYADFARGVTEIIFADGQVWDQVDIAYAVSHVSSASETLYGTGRIDVMDGGTGNDTLRGGGDGDVYIYDVGYGNDLVKDTQDDVLIANPDYVAFGANVAIDDVTFTRSGGSNDLIITIVSTGETLTIEGQFNASYTGILGKQWFQRVEMFAFADGDSVEWNEIIEDMPVLLKTEGNDTIYGFSWEDTLDGGAGDDYLSGGNENDTYLFGLGYGHDTIRDKQMDAVGVDSIDTVQFLEGVDPNEVTVTRDGASSNLVITLIDGSTLTIERQFHVDYAGIGGVQKFDQIEYFKFSDEEETVWTAAQLIEHVIDDTITSGNDETYGFKREDTFAASAGDDRIEGGAEGDDYHFGRGSGHDTIYDEADAIDIGDGIDRIVMASDILTTDIELLSGPGSYDLTLRIKDTGDTITIENQNRKYIIGPMIHSIEQIVFADSTTWSAQDLRDMYIANAATSGNDTIYGYWYADTIEGGTGDDYMAGGGGGDTYLWGPGAGDDIIHDYIQYITWNQADKIVFDSAIDSTDAIYTKVGDDLVIELTGYTDSLTVDKFFNSTGYYAIELFEFSDVTLSKGDVYTITVGSAHRVGTSANDSLTGTAGNDLLEGMAGNDTLSGSDGDDTIDGGAGDDYLIGGTGGDTFIASEGIDTIDELGGFDEILFGPGITLEDLHIYRYYGSYPYQHMAIEWGDGNKIIVLGQYYGGSPVEQIRFDDDTTYSLIDNDVLTVGTSGNDNIGGGVGSGNDILEGFAGNDDISSGAGNDILDGGEGDDTLSGGTDNDIYVASPGTDYIDEDGGIDTIVFGEGIALQDLTFRKVNDYPYSHLNIYWGAGNLISVRDFYAPNISSDTRQVEFLQFADGSTFDLLNSLITQQGTSGNDTLSGAGTNDHEINTSDIIYGLAGNDSITANAGDDTIYGGAGDDYIEAGSGNDIVEGNEDADTIYGEDGNDAIYGNDGNDTRLDGGNGDDIVYGGAGNDIIYGGASNDTLYGEEGNDTVYGGSGNDYIEGGDGDDTLNGEADIDRLVGGLGNDTLSGGTGNDYLLGEDGTDILNGNDGDDILDGGDGNDALNGGNNNDTIFGGDGDDIINPGTGNDYVYAGNGHDQVTDTSSSSSSQKYVHGEDGDDTISLGDSNDFIYGGNGNDVISGGSGNDFIDGGEGNDTLNGNSFNDTIYGGAGDDTINSGTGNDTVYAGSGNDVIQATVASGSSDDIKYIYGEAGNDFISMADAADHIYGGDGDDIIVGNGGDDIMDGGLGDDQYRYIYGDDEDFITDAGGYDVIEFTDTTTPENLDFFTENHDAGSVADDVKVDFNNTSTQEIVVYNQVSSTLTNNKIEELRFSDQFSLNFSRYGTSQWVQIGNSTTTHDSSSATTSRTILGGTNTNTITGSAYADEIHADTGNDTVYGGAGDDRLHGGSGTDTIYGGDGHDEIWGGTGADTLRGEAGDDVYYYGASGGLDTVIETGGDNDRLVIQHKLQSEVSWTRTGDNLVIDTDSTGNNKITINNFYLGGHANAVEVLEFSDGSTLDLYSLSNQAPMAQNDSFTTNEDVVKTGNVLADNGNGTDTDPDNDVIVVTTGTFNSAEGGLVTLGSDGDFSYTPLSNFYGTDSFSYEISDGRGGADMAIVTITVSSVNDAPEAQTDSYNGPYNTAVTGNILADNGNGADSDAENDTLQVTTLSVISTYGYVVSIAANGDFTYTPGTDFAGIDSFVYSISDGNGGTDTGVVAITITAPSGAIVGSSGNDTINGTSGNDVIFGMDGDDVINAANGNDSAYGGSGSDSLYGGNGNDTLIGGPGNDLLYGEANDDTLMGSAGDDLLDGGSGSSDTADYRYATSGIAVNLSTSTGTTSNDGEGGSDTLLNIENIIGSEFDDTILVTYGNVNNRIAGLAGNDVMDGWGAYDTLDYSLSPGAISVNLTTGTASDGYGYTDTFSSFERVIGSLYNDTIIGNSFNNDIYDLGGSDNLDGGTGYDILSYEYSLYGITLNADIGVTTDTNGGTDSFINFERYYGSNYNDYIVGTSGADNLDGRNGDDILAGGAGNDFLAGHGGIDFADYRTAAGAVTANLSSGSASNDGDGGIDTLQNIEGIIGSAYNDTLTGKSSDYDYLRGGAGNDVLDGGGGIDYLDYSMASSGVIVNLNTNTVTNDGDGGVDTISNLEILIGSAYDDILTQKSGNIVYGGAGNDAIYMTGSGSIYAGTGDDTVYAVGSANIYDEDGDDTYDGTSATSMQVIYSAATMAITVNLAAGWVDVDGDLVGDDTIIAAKIVGGTLYNDTFYGSSSGETFTGNSGNDVMYGYAGIDTLYSGAGDDVLYGGDGNDNLWSQGDGTNSMYGEAGDDLFVAHTGMDTMDGGAGSDELYYSQASSAVSIDMSAGTVDEGRNSSIDDTFINMEKATGSSYDDLIIGDANSNTLSGGSGNDELRGGSGHDTLQGGNGNDIIHGDIGNDTILGGAGSDSAAYQISSTNFIIQRSSSSYLTVVDTSDRTYATGHGADMVYSDTEYLVFNDITIDLSTLSLAVNGEGWGTAATVYGTASNETWSGYNARDVIYGGGGNDTVNGNHGNDDLYGDAGTDTLNGGAANDKLYGGADNDSLSGGDGNDLLYGQDGVDTMTGGNGADQFVFEAVSAFSNIDTISDFSTAQGDAINISDVISLYDPLNDAITDWVEMSTSGSNTILKVDQDGTGTTHGWTQIATLTGVTGLTDEAALVTNGNLIV